MINVLGENYYIDLDVIEKYLDMSNDISPEALSGTTEMKINVIKFEMVKMLLETVLTEDKQARIYFLVQDTKGNAKASVRLIYQMAKTLKDNGFNPIILHEKADYSGVVAWLSEEYMSLPHKAIEGQNLEISPEDFLVIPEVFGYIMDQVKQLPCAKIVLTQQYAHMLETLQPGQSWNQFGFMKCITT